MKTLRKMGMALTMAILAISFTSCGDDDDKDVPENFIGNDPGLVATWIEVQEEDLVTLTFKSDGTYIETEIDGTTKEKEVETGTWKTNETNNRVRMVVTDSSDRDDIGKTDVKSYKVENQGYLRLDGDLYINYAIN